MTRWIACAAVLLFCAPMAAPGAGRYIVTHLGDPPAHLPFSFARGINSQGQVVGTSNDLGGFNSRAFLWTPITPNSTTGSMSDLGDLPGGREFSAAHAINSQGQVTGYSDSGNLEYHAFLWTPTMPNSTIGSMVNLGDLPGGADHSLGYGINSLGQVVGQSTAATGSHAFLWTPTTPNGTTGSMVDIGALPDGPELSTARGINSTGQVVGESNIGTGIFAFLWTPTTPNGSSGSMISLGDLPGGEDRGRGEAINSFGQIVGVSEAATGNRAFLWTPNGTTGSMIDLGDLPGGSDNSFATGINSQGQVVGFSGTATGLHAFLWTPTTPNGTTGAMVDLHTLVEPTSAAGWELVEATGINDLGQISGSGTFDPDGPGPAQRVTRGFLLTLVPEPSITILIGLGASLITYTALGRSGRNYRSALKRSVAVTE